MKQKTVKPKKHKIYTGIDLITRERLRQISAEGFTAEHDEWHINGELSAAAVGYAMMALFQVKMECPYGSGFPAPTNWPWLPHQWNPSETPYGNLIKAGALIAAELDRLLRMT